MTVMIAEPQQTELAKRDASLPPEVLEHVLATGDLSRLNSRQRVQYIEALCARVGVDVLTRPFEYIELGGKLVLYARRDCTDQLRSSKKISVKILSRETVNDIYVVTAEATDAEGRHDESVGAVPLIKEDGEWKTAQSGKKYFSRNGSYIPLTPEERANAIMKAETKAKRRVTLSICGLGMIDESELDTVRHQSPAAAVELALPEQVQEIKNLLAAVKLPDGTIEKWFAKAGAEDWSEFPAANLDQCITYLKNRLPSGKEDASSNGNKSPSAAPQETQAVDKQQSPVEQFVTPQQVDAHEKFIALAQQIAEHENVTWADALRGFEKAARRLAGKKVHEMSAARRAEWLNLINARKWNWLEGVEMSA